MASLADRFAQCLIKLGYPNASQTALSAKVQWMTEFENVRPVLEWICQGVTQKNFLTQNELDAFEELSVESKGIDVENIFGDDGEDEGESLEEIEKEISLLKKELESKQKIQKSLEFQQHRQEQLTLEIDTNSKVIDQALKKIELESQEQNQKLLVESINYDKSLQELMEVIETCFHVLTEQTSGSLNIHLMKNEMEMFESSSEVLKIGIEEYLEKQLNQIDPKNGPNNQDLNRIQQSLYLTKKEHSEVEAEYVSLTKSLDFLSQLPIVNTSTFEPNFVNDEIRDKKEQIKKINQQIQEYTILNNGLTEQLSNILVTPILFEDLNKRIQIGEKIDNSIREMNMLLSELYCFHLCIFVAVKLEFQIHIQTSKFLQSLKTSFEKQNQERAERFTQNNVSETETQSENTMIESSNKFILSLNSILDDNSNSTFLVPISSLKDKSKKLLDELNNLQKEVDQLQQTMQSTISSITNCSEDLHRLLLLTPGTTTISLTPTVLIQHQTMLKEKTDFLQSKLKQLLVDATPSGDLNQRMKIFQLFHNSPETLTKLVQLK